MLKLSTLDPKLRERIQHQIDQEDSMNNAVPIQAIPSILLPTPPKRLRQTNKPLMNKLEAEFYGRIKDAYPNYPPIRIQAKTYRLANGLRYTPDFTASSWPGDGGPAQETAWEVKGPWIDGDSFPKLKMAASVWPEVRWLLVWKDSTGQWNEQRILP